MSKIALSMIVKGTDDEAPKLRRALSTIASHVDARFITITGPKDQSIETQKVCNEFNCRVSFTDATTEITQEMVSFIKENFYDTPHMKVGDRIFLFDKARNFNMEQITQDFDWIVWMDCDDVFRNAQNLKLLAEEGIRQNIEAFYFNYLYEVETTPEGKITNIIIQHLRERLLRNHGVYKWIAPIHETLIEQRPTRKTDSDACDVVHLAEQADRYKSLERNLRNLEYSVWETKGKDPRPIYYLAKAFYDLNTPDYTEKSIKLINLYLDGENPSGWIEERAQAWQYLAELYRRKNEHNNSIKCCMNALIESPEDPSIFINLGISYMIKHEWERALYWVKLATAVPQKKTTLVINPKDIQARMLEVIYNSCLNLSKVDEAWASAQKLVELLPENESVKQALQFISNIRTQRELTKDVLKLSEYLKQTGEVPKIKALLDALPASIKDNPFMVNLYQQNNPPSVWGEKDIAIYCGQGFTSWSPKRLDNPGEAFVGGSEEAVILMAESLQIQGWNVTVYGDPGPDEGEYGGVKWLPYYKFNRLDHFNILIGWRDIRFFETKFDAKKKYLWCHDIQNGMEYTPERVANVDRVFFLSKWHYENDLTLQRNLPKEKTFFTSNGVII